MPIDVLNTLVKIASDTAGTPGTFATIADVTGYAADHGSEDPTETRVFGAASPHVRGGSLTADYSIEGLYHLTDTNGQNIIRTAYFAKDEVWIQVLLNGTTGYQQRCTVTNYSDDGEADGEYIGVAFELRGIDGTYAAVP